MSSDTLVVLGLNLDSVSLSFGRHLDLILTLLILSPDSISASRGLVLDLPVSVWTPALPLQPLEQILGFKKSFCPFFM